MMKLYSIIFGFIVMAMIIGSCAEVVTKASAQSEQVELSKHIQSLLDIDFSEFVAGCTFATFDTPGLIDDDNEQRRMEYNRRYANEAGAESFTAGDLKRLGICELPDGKLLTLWDINLKLGMYYVSHGDLPDNALGLFPELCSLSVEEISALDKEELFQKYAVGINPITGKFYTSFTSQTWTPGGYCIEIVDDAEEIAERLPHRRSYSDPADVDSELVRPDSVWHITIYGEELDSVIYESGACVNRG